MYNKERYNTGNNRIAGLLMFLGHKPISVYNNTAEGAKEYSKIYVFENTDRFKGDFKLCKQILNDVNENRDSFQLLSDRLIRK